MPVSYERIKAGIDEWAARTFVSREILIRANGRVSYLTFSSRLQKFATGVGVVLGVWLLASSTSLLISTYFLQKKDSEVEIARLAYEGLLEDVARSYDQFHVLTGDLDDDARGLLGLSDVLANDNASVHPDPDAMRHKLAMFRSDLRMIASYNGALRAQIATLEEELAAARDTESDLEEANADLEGDLSDLEARLASAIGQNGLLQREIAGLQDELAIAEVARDSNALTAENLNRRIALLEQDLAGAVDGNIDRDERIALMQQVIASVVDERNDLASIKSELGRQLGELQQRLAAVQSSQHTVAQQLAERTLSGVEEVEKIVTMTGLDVERLLEVAGEELDGKGGPFISASAVHNSEAAELVMASVADLDSAVSRLERLQLVMRSLPITAPLDNYYTTSGFGRRTDPFNGTVALHEGLDLVSNVGAEVLATAPGIVIFAGWQGEYGRLVEIDHGLGITTRYAHLKEIWVEVGQTVDYRDEIGLLGSSGRSTGPHVHYEVRFNDTPFNPMNFLKAGRYVFKG
ncbi:MAG: peptidoglycan DD-metalloendopeptidase family protein [Dongiaceae bacterium]